MITPDGAQRFPSNFTLPSLHAAGRGSIGDIAKSVGGGIKDVASGFGDVAKRP